MNITFDDINNKKLVEIGPVWLNDLFAPDSRGWFNACRIWVQGGTSPDLPKIDCILNSFTKDYSHIPNIARAHIDCAKFALFFQPGTDSAEELTPKIRQAEKVQNIAKGRKLSYGLICDLVRELTRKEYGGGYPRSPARELSLAVLLVDKDNDEGVLANLLLELIPDGNGELYSAPELAFVSQDGDFCRAQGFACGYIKKLWPEWKQKWDLRWRLKLQDNQRRMPLALIGNSAGVAFALGIAKLLADNGEESSSRIIGGFRKLNLYGTAITSGLASNGSLSPVGGLFPKLLKAAREKALPRIHTVVVAEEQRPDVESIDPKLLEDNPYNDFRALCAPNITEAVEALNAQWKNIIDCTLELSRHENVIGREWLQGKVNQFVGKQKSGYLLLVGGAITGKSAFVAEQVRRGQQKIVYHFIKQGMGNWDDPDDILRSLIEQLRRKYRLPLIDLESDEQPKSLSAVFSDVLWQVNGSLSDSEKEVIYIDGLDEAFGPTGRFAQESLLNFLPQMLPEKIIIVLTSRPDDFLGDLTLQGLEKLNLDDEIEANQEDITDYIHQQNRTRNLGLEEDFIAQLVKASGGVFGIAELYLHERENLYKELERWRKDPSQIPGNLTEWLGHQWNSIVTAAGKEGIVEEAVRGIFGMLVTAREPLSNDQLSFVLDCAVQRNPNARLGFCDVYEIGKNIDKVLRLSQDFFRPLSPTRGVDEPYRFYHTSFPEFIDKKLKYIERKDCHRLLAEASLPRWRRECFFNDYAIRYITTHLIALAEQPEIEEQWKPLLRELLCKSESINIKFNKGMIDDLINAMADAQKVGVELKQISSSLVEVLQIKKRSDNLWRELHSALNQSFGLYSEWPKCLQECLKESQNRNVMFFLGSVYDMEGEHERAVEVFRKMLNIIGKEDLQAYDVVQVLVAALRHWADELKGEGCYEESKRCREEALKEVNEYINLPMAKKAKRKSYAPYWWCRYQRGIVLRELHQYDLSKAELEYLYEKKPVKGIRISSLHHLGVLQLELGLLKKAEETFEGCLKMQSESKWNHRRAYDLRRLGQICALTGNFDRANDYFKEAEVVSKRCADSRYVRKIIRDRKLFIDIPKHLIGTDSKKMPKTISLKDFANQFDVDKSDLVDSFRVLSEQDLGYVQAIDEDSAESKDFVVRRDIAHNSKDYWHATVAVLVFDSQGNFALQKRVEEPAGKWDVSAAGHKAIGESDDVAAVRETGEELGIIVGVQRLERIGEPYEFRKEGSPGVEADSRGVHKSSTFYMYQTKKINRERVSVFVLKLSEEESEQIKTGCEGKVQKVKWMELSEAVEEAEAKPEEYASAFKHLLTHDDTFNCIQDIANSNTGGTSCGKQ